MMNLVPAIKEMEKEINLLDSEYKSQRNGLEAGLNALRQLNTVCEKCNGNKQIMRPRACAEDDREREMVICPACNGSGLARKKEAAEVWNRRA